MVAQVIKAINRISDDTLLSSFGCNTQSQEAHRNSVFFTRPALLQLKSDQLHSSNNN